MPSPTRKSTPDWPRASRREPALSVGAGVLSAVPPAILITTEQGAERNLHLPFLDINGYYNFLGAMMIVLFIVGLVVVFVYEYEALRRSKT